MKKIKKALSVLLIIAFCFMFTVASFAEERSIFDKLLNDALSASEPIKAQLNLSDVDFTKLYIGAPIKSYICSHNKAELNYDYYPLFFNDTLRAYAVNVENDFCQITTSFVNETKNCFLSSVPFAFVFDKTGCFLFDGEYTKINSYDEDESREDISETDLSGIQLNIKKNRSKVNYYSSMLRSTNSASFINVSHVSQGTDNKICWAASIACISNYLNGTNLSAQQIARNYYGSDYNHGINASQSATLLRQYSGYSYSFVSGFQPYSKFTTNIQADRPVYVSFNSPTTIGGDGNNHAVVVYGIGDTVQTLYIMDPLGSFTYANYINSDGWYRFYNSSVNRSFVYGTYYGEGIICRY